MPPKNSSITFLKRCFVLALALAILGVSQASRAADDELEGKATASDEKETKEKEKDKEKDKDKKDDKAAEKAKDEAPVVDFSSEKTFLDVPDALRSRNYVSRAILSTTIKETSSAEFGRMYINNLIGYDAIFQPANRGPFVKYASGDIAFGAGYVSEGGHSVELGLSLSSISTISISYRYVFHPRSFGFWPYAGLGLGAEMGALAFADKPIAAKAYLGSTEMMYPVIGVMIPLIDVGLKLETRFVFYGLDRLVLTTGAGVVFFL